MRGSSLWTPRWFYIRGTVAVLLPNGQVVSGSSNPMIRIWNTESGECEAIFSGHEDRVNNYIARRKDRIILLMGYNDIRIWNTATGDC